MRSQLIYLDEQIGIEQATGLEFDSARDRVWNLIRIQYPLSFGIVQAVTYNAKTDRYVLKASGNSMKCTNDVAEFLLWEGKTGQTYGPLPTVQAHMTDGLIDAVCVIFLSKS